MTDDEDVQAYINSLDIAINKEKNAIAFYKTAARIVQNEGAQGLFRDLMEGEREHERMLTDYRMKVTSEKMMDPADLEIQVFEDSETSGKSLYPLIIALKREEKAMEFYESLSVRTPDPGLKALYGRLSEEEGKHLGRIKTMMNDMVHSRDRTRSLSEKDQNI